MRFGGTWGRGRVRFKKINIESRVNSVPGWEFEFVGDLVDLPLYWKRTNVLGTQLLTGWGGADLGWTAILDLLDNMLEWKYGEHLQMSSGSTLHVGVGCERSPTLSHSP